MINKERLEEVISRWNRERDDYDWLVEQARQVEYLSRIIDSQNQSLAELMEENERYREAIEFGIEYLKNSDIRQVQLVVTALKSALGVRNE